MDKLTPEEQQKARELTDEIDEDYSFLRVKNRYIGRPKGLNVKELKYLLRIFGCDSITDELESDIKEVDDAIGCLDENSRIKELLLSEKKFLEILLGKIEAVTR